MTKKTAARCSFRSLFANYDLYQRAGIQVNLIANCKLYAIHKRKVATCYHVEGNQSDDNFLLRRNSLNLDGQT